MNLYKMYLKLVHCVCVNLALQPEWHINTFHNVVLTGCWGLGKSGWDFGPADDWPDWKKPVALCQHHDRIRSRWDNCKRLLIWLRLKHATSWMLNVSLVLSLFLYELWTESGGKFSTAQWEFLSFPCCTSGCKQTCHVLAISLWFCRSKTDQHFRACVLLREALEAKCRIQMFILVESLHLLQETTTPYMLKKYSIKSETVG